MAPKKKPRKPRRSGNGPTPKKATAQQPEREPLPLGTSPAPKGWEDRLFMAMGHRLRQGVLPDRAGGQVDAVVFSFAVAELPPVPGRPNDFLHVAIPPAAAKVLGQQLIEFAERIRTDPTGLTADPVDPPPDWDPDQ